ncbi:MAG: cell surface protein SprA, partial [Bacteroidia bacterium]
MKKSPFLSKAIILLSAAAAFGQVSQLIDVIQQSDSYAAYDPTFVDSFSGPDTPKLKFPIDTTKKPGDGKSHSLDLKDPSNIKKKTVYDTASGKFITTRSIGDSTDLGSKEYYNLDEYLDKSNDDYLKDYFKSRAKASNFTSNSNADLKFKINEGVLEDVFGEEFVDIKPQGSAELIFMGEINRVENPAWSVRTQRNGQFKFDQKIRLNVLGKIGDKINLNLNYDTEANFEFDNQIKLNWQGKEDDIVKSIEAGNVSLPVQGSLISGSSNLFGIKTTMQFGRLTATAVVSKQNTERKEITVDGGAQKTAFNIPANEYDANKHFFLSQYFRNNYNAWAANSPLVMSPIQITRCEVWVTNYNGRPQETRNMVAFMDMGEKGTDNEGEPNLHYNNGVVFKEDVTNVFPGPSNDANSLFDDVLYAPSKKTKARSLTTVNSVLAQESFTDPEFAKGVDYAVISNVRKLSESEYKLHNRLGFISLRTPLPDNAVLAVSFEYTLDGETKQVGEFSRDIPANPSDPNVLFLKMLKSDQIRTDLPLWDLMMKNVYSLGSNRIEESDFRLEIIYADDESGADLAYIPEPSEPKLKGKQLIKVLGVDKINKQQQPMPDGVFDYVPNLTIDTENGFVFLPVLEPFGDHLFAQFKNQDLANDYVYRALYDSIQQIAIQDAYFNKFFLKGFFKGTSSDEIPLNAFNIQPGSVKVTAGGVELVENQDYRVDYTLGRVKILNESILSSGQQINVSHESNTLFQTMQKALYGTRLDYKISEDFGLGGTLLHLRERPITPKVNVGDEPLKNTIYGFDGRYRTDSRLLTKMVNRLPLIDTKEESEISISGEFAHLIPGFPKVIGETGTSYLDDFEGSEIPYDLRLGVINWTLASTPQGQRNLFPYASTIDADLSNNYRRAKMAWYILDPLFYNDNNLTPSHLRRDVAQLSNHYVRQVTQNEVFPQLDRPLTQIPTQPTLDLAYYPKERGPYNYETDAVNTDGTLKDPKSNWAGIMRRIETINFEAANIEYVEFWMMDPYIYNPEAAGGDLYINLGQVSEDVLQDSRKAFEHGLPTDGSDDNTVSNEYGKTPTIPNINHAFPNDASARQFQDVGLDGLNDKTEKEKFREVYLDVLKEKFGENSQAYQKALKDPSTDNYSYFRGDSLDQIEASIFERYKNFSNPQGNSPTPDGNGDWPDGYPTSAKVSPDDEDINKDFTLNTTEAYYQYKIALRPDEMKVGQNYITDILETSVPLKNGGRETIKWYQVKIPIRSYQRKIGPISGFKSIQFMRMFLTGFEDSVMCRFAQLQLIRADWRRYLYDLTQPGEVVTTDPFSNTVFDISTVNIEENSERTPINYVVPPGIVRELNANNIQQTQQNEQSLSLRVCNLEDGDARAVFKTTEFDVRQFKRLRMFVHAEGTNLKDNDLSLFIRLGTDLSGHYYEYEFPLKITEEGTFIDDDIWPEANEINMLLEEFYNVKLARDADLHPMTQMYSRFDTEGRGVVSVLGNPDLSNLRTIMIGVKNPRAANNPFDQQDDGLPKCGEVWVNELRLTDFDQTGGWAANARLKAKMADFAQFDIVGHRKTIGFGGIEQTLLERSQEDERGIDFRSSFALDKFFPQKAGVKLPMYYDYSQKNIRPRFNPLQPDVLLESTLASMVGDSRKDLLDKVEEVEIRRSLNFVNVSKSRTNLSHDPFPWEISNFTGTYKFTETIKRDIFTTFDSTRTYTGILGYNYKFPEANWQPLKKLGKYKSLKLLSDFNVGYLPSNFNFQGQLDRRYNTVLFRNNDNVESIIPPNYNKTFRFDRKYGMRWNLTKGLKLNYTANAQSIIDEPEGSISTQKKRDTVLSNLQSLGRPQQYQQSVNLNYKIPINKLPLMDFVNASGDYKGGFGWQAAPPIADSLGNSITNSAAYSLNTQFNFIQLYNKSQFLRNVNSGRSNVDKIQKNREKKEKEKLAEAKKKGLDVKVEEKDDDEDEEEDEYDLVNEGFIKALEGGVRVLMAARSFNVNYQVNEGTQLPGFMPSPQYLGNNFDQDAPGLPFILGSQQDIRYKAADNGWLTYSENQLNFYRKTYTENLTGNATLEPIKSFRITVDFNRRYASSLQENFRNQIDEQGNNNFIGLGSLETGNLSMSFNTIRTSFVEPVLKHDSAVALYDFHPLVEQFEDNRKIISDRIAAERGITAIDDSTGYAKGYSYFSQDVLVPSFLAAMSGADASEVELSPFWKLPMPNWRVSYNGLSRVKALKKYFRTVNINHTYRSTYAINNYTSSLEYENSISVAPEDLDRGQDYLSQFQIQQISISEQFAPLFGIDVTWKNNWSTKFEYQRSRTMAFNFTNFQLQEMFQKSLVIGIGYRTKELTLPFKY